MTYEKLHVIEKVDTPVLIEAHGVRPAKFLGIHRDIKFNNGDHLSEYIPKEHLIEWAGREAR